MSCDKSMFQKMYSDSIDCNVCFYCNKKFTINEVKYSVTVDDGKPPGTPNRWRKVGYSCERCDSKENK